MSTQTQAPAAFGITDFYYVAAGAAVFGSGGGGSYTDAIAVLDELAQTQFAPVPVQPYPGEGNACVLAMMGSPDAGQSLHLQDVQGAIYNTMLALENANATLYTWAAPVEIGALNSLIPLIAGTMDQELTVVDGDGCGRAVPQLVNTTYSGAAKLPVSPCILGNQAIDPTLAQSTVLNVSTTAQAEGLARGVVSEDFGSIAGFAAWSSLSSNQFALSDNYIQGTLGQAWQLGQYLLESGSPPSSADVAAYIGGISGRATSVIASGLYVTQVSQTTAGGFDTGIVRLDNAPAGQPSTATYYLYNTNESLILYSASASAPLVIAPDSICYYSESTGRGFSNAADDLAPYLGSTLQVSILKITALPQLCQAAGVMEAFAALLLKIGYGGPLPAP